MCKNIVSVVVPVYNAEQYISQCVDSILRQSYRDIQVLLVDDGSNDSSLDLCKIYGREDARIQVLTDINRGVSHARNVGLAMAKGEYICFVDADDIIAEDYLETLITLIRKYDADISMFKSVSHLKGNAFHNFSSVVNDEPASLLSKTEALKSILFYQTPIGCYNRMFRTEFLRNNKISFSENLYIGEGFNFNIDCFCKANKICLSLTKSYFYRLDNKQSAMTSVNWSKVRNGLKAIDLIEEKLSNSPEFSRAVDYAIWHTYCDFYLSVVGSTSVHTDNQQELSTIMNRVRSVPERYWSLPISYKQKIKIFLFRISPRFASLVINLFRSRSYA